MNKYPWICVTILSFTSIAVQSSDAPQHCSALAQVTIKRLSRYVQEKYQIPFDVTVSSEDISFVNHTCFRQLMFTSDRTANKVFSLRLFLSPDGRFLSHELMDSEVNPVKEELERNQIIISKLLQRRAPSLGRSDAPLKVTIFSDFQCPYCKEEAGVLREEVLPYEPNIQILYRYLPLSIHEWSKLAARAAACAAEQDDTAFWAVHDFLFQHQRELSVENIYDKVDAFVRSNRAIDSAKFTTCLLQNTSLNTIELDIALARSLEIHSTPTIFVNGTRIDGVASAEQIRTLIRQTLRQSDLQRMSERAISH